MRTNKNISVTRRARGAFIADRLNDFVPDTIKVANAHLNATNIPKNAVAYIRLGNQDDYPIGSDANRGAWFNIIELMELSTTVDTLIEEWYEKRG